MITETQNRFMSSSLEETFKDFLCIHKIIVNAMQFV